MSERLDVLIKRYKRKGFAGPRYPGLWGKVRFALESLVARRELVFALSPADFAKVEVSAEPGFEVVRIPSLEALEPFREDLEARWYPGLLESWAGPMEWQERLFLGLQDGRPISFNWLQIGSRSGAHVHWGRVLDGEYRIVRGGVAHEWRGKGVNTRMKHAIIKQVFEGGGQRFHAECYEANIPSVRTLTALGFRIVGRLEVLELPGLRGFVRWRSLS